MNIVMFTNTFKPHVGGVANSIDALAKGLRKTGQRVVIVAPTFPGVEIEFDTSRDIIRVPSVQNFNGSDFSVRIPVPFAVASAMELIRPDIIHSHHPFLLGDSAIRMARQFNIPIIFTHHTRYEHYTHYVLNNLQLRRFAATLATEYANLCSGVIAPSNSMKNLMAERGVRVPIEVIPSGVDIDKFSITDPYYFHNILQGKSENPQIIGHLGRLSEEKNLKFLMESVVQAMLDNKNIHFFIAGDGPMRKEMELYFNSMELSSRVTFFGTLEGQDLINFYSALDLFLFTSKSETQGMVVTEAMAAGTPVVALDAPGVREVVNDRNGRKLPENTSTKEFSRVINKELDYTKNKGIEALNTAKELSQELTINKTLNFYNERIHKHHPERSYLMPESMDPLLHRISAEWELFSEKTTAMLKM